VRRLIAGTRVEFGLAAGFGVVLCLLWLLCLLCLLPDGLHSRTGLHSGLALIGLG
jgi:hypothetical protein